MDRNSSFTARNILLVEQLEDRTVPSIFTPAQIQQAYSFNQISFSTSNGTVIGNGAGQTIAIVDAYDDPNIASDLETFDKRFGIPDAPSFTVVKQSGTVANAGWTTETALDVEWAHAMAPGARIVLGEARSDSLSDLVAEVDTVADMPGVSAVAMSWSAEEWASEGSFDSNFTTPAGHQGVTYVASSGDDGAPPSWPASSPNVLSVGGTTLYVYSNGSYENETGWNFSGGGVSEYEAKPSYQYYVSTGSSMRSNPDVSFDANAATGLYVYNSYGGGGWVEVGGTSAGAPQWAALVAIADQGRALQGKTTLDGASQTLYAIYRMAQTSETTYFHDISSGNNGYAAKAGYDDVTGNGSPIANMIVAGLVAWNGAGATGSIGSITSSLTAAKVKAQNSDFASPAVPPGEITQFLAPTPLVTTALTTVVPASASLLTSNGSVSLLAPSLPKQNTSVTPATVEFSINENISNADSSPLFDMSFDVNWSIDVGSDSTRETALPSAADVDTICC
jgi:subtilase family serine protease